MLLHKKLMDSLSVQVYDTRAEMGAVAAELAEARIKSIISKNGEANIVFAAAPSQLDFLASLLQKDINWGCVRAFQQDEYLGLDSSSPAGFGNFLDRHVYNKVSMKEIHYLSCTQEKAQDKCDEYTALLERYPPDIIFLGVGENGHLAFNDPPVADFEDPQKIKIVELDMVCRNQQVNDGCFQNIGEVPTCAITLTMSQILSIPFAIAIVPTALKANAVRDALQNPISPSCPASALRMHKMASLYLDADSAKYAFA